MMALQTYTRENFEIWTKVSLSLSEKIFTFCFFLRACFRWTIELKLETQRGDKARSTRTIRVFPRSFARVEIQSRSQPQSVPPFPRLRGWSRAERLIEKSGINGHGVSRVCDPSFATFRGHIPVQPLHRFRLREYFETKYDDIALLPMKNFFGYRRSRYLASSSFHRANRIRLLAIITIVVIAKRDPGGASRACRLPATSNTKTPSWFAPSVLGGERADVTQPAAACFTKQIAVGKKIRSTE